MAWRDDKARATLIREAAGNMRPGKTPRTFVELLFDHTNIEDLANYDAASLAFLAEQAWEHVQRRTAGRADIRVINPMMPDGREISVLEVLNDNMPFLFDSTMAELAEQGIEVTLVAHPIIAVERDEQGKLLRFYGETLTAGAKGERESLIHFHITRLDADADRQRLIEGLTKTLNDVRACVTDWRAMRAVSNRRSRPSTPIRRRCQLTRSPKPPNSCNGCAPTISPSLACASIASRPTPMRRVKSARAKASASCTIPM